MSHTDSIEITFRGKNGRETFMLPKSAVLPFQIPHGKHGVNIEAYPVRTAEYGDKNGHRRAFALHREASHDIIVLYTEKGERYALWPKDFDAAGVMFYETDADAKKGGARQHDFVSESPLPRPPILIPKRERE